VEVEDGTPDWRVRQLVSGYICEGCAIDTAEERTRNPERLDPEPPQDRLSRDEAPERL
jgi:hypothetical protein